MTALALLVGLVVGMVSGVVGIGGGVLFIPALVWLFNMNQYKAQAPRWERCWPRSGSLPFSSTTAKATRPAHCPFAGRKLPGGGYFGAVGAQRIPEIWL